MLEKIFLNYRIKKHVKHLENYLKGNFPWIYTHIFLPWKYLAKQLLFYWTTRAKDDQGVTWPQESAESLGETVVSVIVPCYNHAEYLHERLESIYHQSYQPIEVILLDDGSTDGSQDILKEYYRRYPEITKIILSEKNSRSVFHQWEKGLSAAKGKYVWIAESDDWCERNFLEKLMPAFRDGEVMLSFSRSDFMRSGKKVWTIESYLHEVRLDWTHPFSITAHDLVQEAFAWTNVIPNVSSAVFRNVGKISDEVLTLWQDMRLCGDWLFYLYLIKGGAVYYTNETTNYYRIHGQSTSLQIQRTARYYKENELIACYVARNYRVSFTCHQTHLRHLEEHYLSYAGGNNREDVKQWFDLEKIKQASAVRCLNVLICVFSMAWGGGETFPIFLANELRRQGVAVTLLDFHLDMHDEAVRQLVSPSVPCLRLSQVKNLPRIMKHFDIDIVHSQHASVDEIVSHFVDRQQGRVRHVITLHGMYETVAEEYLQPLLHRIEQSCSAYVYTADKNLRSFAKVSEDVKQRFIKLENGLPYYPGTPIDRSSLGIASDAFVLCLVSRAIPEKGWKEAVEAVIFAREKSSQDIQLLLIGSGEMYEQLKGNVPPFVHLLGYRTNIRDYFAASDMGFLPSSFLGESFPLVIIDCLFCEKPMLATDVGEIRNELVTASGELAGIVIKLEHGKPPVAKLAEAICEVASHPDLYMRLQDRAKLIAPRFSIDNVARHYREVYKKAARDVVANKL